MFNLTLHDHLHLTFTEILERHDAHAAKASVRARWSCRLRAGEALLIGGVSIAATGAAFGRGQIFAIVAAALAGLALIILLVQLSFDLDASARAHAASRVRLWELLERYRSLLSELHDGAVSVAEARVRRDALIDNLRAIYETTSVIALEDDRVQSSPAPGEAMTPEPPSIAARPDYHSPPTTNHQPPTAFWYPVSMAEPKDPHRERIEELGRMNTIYSERPWHDWKPGTPPKHDHFTHDNPRAVDDEHPDKPDRD